MAELPALVGRDEERARLLHVLARCRAGCGGLLLISGEAGVGKSRLVTEALAGWTGSQVTATAVTAGRAYAPLLGVLRTGVSAELPEGWRDDPAATFLDRLEAVTGGKPTVVVLEDLHLADAATVDLLPALAERLESEAVLLIGIYRSDELPRSHAIRALRAQLRRAGRLDDIAVRPLQEEQTAQLLSALLGAPPAPHLVAAVHLRADGLPFFVQELAAALLETEALVQGSGGVDVAAARQLPLPESVTDAVLVRTADLRRQHGEAVEYAATLGEQVELPTLAELAGPTQIDPLIEAGLLVEFDTGIAVFRHALVREALHRSIPWARRRDRHQRVAEFLTRRGAAPAVIARHWIAAHSPDRARPLLLAAAREDCARHAYRDAAALAQHALALWPADQDPAGRLATLEELAGCAELGSDVALAARTWADAARAHRAAGHLSRAAAAHRRAANAAEMLGDRLTTTSERLAAAEAFTVVGATGEAAVEHLALAEQLGSAGRLTDALEHAVAATEAAATADRRDVRAHAMAYQGSLRAALGEVPYGVELARSGLALALSERLTEAAAHSLYELGAALEYAADYAASVEAYASAFDLCRSHDLTDLAPVCFVCMSPVNRLMGNWDQTLAICGEVLGDDTTPLFARRVAEEESGLITALRGEGRRARGPLRRAADFGRSGGVLGLEVGARWGLAVVADLDEDEPAARHAVDVLLERCQSTEECHYALPALRWAATFLAGRNDAGGVATCHRVVAALAIRNGAPKVLSALAHVGGELAVVEGDLQHAATAFARSTELLTAITAPYEQAGTQLRRGQAAAAAGDRDAAISSLTSAYRTARRLAARPLARRCADALTAMGEPVDLRLGRLAARGLQHAGLTRREQEVLRHVADGRTNREIAAALFLSTRTVDMHVRNLFTKLDCRSRTAAVRRAAELGLVPAGTS